MFGYSGKILYIELEIDKVRKVPINNEFCEKYIGGNGFAIRLLYDNTRPRIDPFSPENSLIFAVGPFAGTIVPGSGKYIVQAKSPLTGFMGESVSSGAWGPTLKRAGYDAVVIKGRAEKPVYLFIDDDEVYFRDAKNLWGQYSGQTCQMIVDEIGDENVCVAAIGPAGENMVRFANITNDRFRQAGRTGMGAVMGSKNLKAVAVRGTKMVEAYDLDKLMEKCLNLNERCKGPNVKNYRDYGTPASVSVHNELAALPTRNWQDATFELAEKICGEYINKHHVVKAVACSGCPIACDHLVKVDSGPFAGEFGSVEFESIYALGSECGIGYYPAIVRAVNLCDQLGLDTISTGVVIGWAMECFERGLFTKEDTGGIQLTFGNYEAQHEIIRKIAYREEIGNLLAEGVKKASEKLGKGSERFAMHNKGLELPGYDLRGLKACALGFCTSTRGGCHLRSSMYDFDLKGKIDRFKADKEYGKLVMERENLWAIFESLILCKFMRGAISAYEELSELYTLVTGIKMPPEKLREAGDRIYNLEKAYNIREGWKRSDDYPPPRIMEDPIPSGVAKGSLVKKGEFDAMLNAYFEARGWSMEGIPTKRKLLELGLEDLVEDLGIKED
ncbi:MAG: aldehyde ferredoxin oxidoreductase family protein [Candidatus Bathyarchaeales archaeon]